MSDKEIINLFLKEFKIDIDEFILKKVEELKKNKVSVLHEGRYGITLSVNNLEENVLKIQKIHHLREIIKYLKEIFMCYYINKKYNLSPKIYSINFYNINNIEKKILIKHNKKLGNYLTDRYDYLCGTYLMEKVEYIFCDLFDAYKMKIAHDKKNKFILENFALSLKICIGNYELLLENDINHHH